MISRDELAAYLAQRLQVGVFTDACPNGLQVFGRERIEHLVTCTSVSLELFERAARSGAQAILVHHGLFWDRDSRVIDPLLGRRLQVLLDSGLNLFAYHLPLDAHPELGNNASLATLLELERLPGPFGHYHGMAIGVRGESAVARSLDEWVAPLASALAAAPQVFAYGPDRVRRVGVVSGGAGDGPLLCEAREAGCELYVTGSLSEPGLAVARELGLNVLAVGHYNSEKLGVRAVGDELAEKFQLTVEHLDIPNPI